MKELKFLPEFHPLILDGRKTMTRRPLDPQPVDEDFKEWSALFVNDFYDSYSKKIFIDGVEFDAVPLRVERLQEISKDDAVKEGAIDVSTETSISWDFVGCKAQHPVRAFNLLWDSIYSEKYPWKSNPWVWVIEFRRVNQ